MHNVVSCLVDPSCCLWIPCELEEPAEECESIASSKTEASGERSKRFSERARVVVAASDGVGDHRGHRFGVLMIPQEIGGDTRRPGDRKTAKLDPLVPADRSPVEPHIGPSCLSPRRQRELVDIRREMAEAVERRR